MRRSWTPSIVPNGGDHSVYLVADHLGRLGDVWREADCETTDLETVIQYLLQRSDLRRRLQYCRGLVAGRCDLQLRDVPSGIQDFVERHEGHDRHQLSLRLV